MLSTSDLLVVGGGFTGLCSAHFASLKDSSLRVTVVDQHPSGQSMAYDGLRRHPRVHTPARGPGVA